MEILGQDFGIIRGLKVNGYAEVMTFMNVAGVSGLPRIHTYYGRNEEEIGAPLRPGSHCYFLYPCALKRGPQIIDQVSALRRNSPFISVMKALRQVQ